MGSAIKNAVKEVFYRVYYDYSPSGQFVVRYIYIDFLLMDEVQATTTPLYFEQKFGIEFKPFVNGVTSRTNISDDSKLILETNQPKGS
jgi:hypothetical protein